MPQLEINNIIENTPLPLVSVILPTRNRADLIVRSIDSVIKQTYTNWELIIWDDGSTDNTKEIIDSYKDPRIRYFYDSNHGAHYARNQAMVISQGKYIAFLDSDDAWMEDKLLVQIKFMLANPDLDLVFTNFINIGIATNETGDGFDQCKNAMTILEKEKVGEDLYIIKKGFLKGLTVDNFIATDTVIIRREVIVSYGYFHTDLRSSEDFELWWRLGLADVYMGYTRKTLLIRYKYSGSLSSPSINSLSNRVAALDICLQETIQNDRNDLISCLNKLYRNAWQNFISYYGNIGDRNGIFVALFKALKYGIRLGTIRLLIIALLTTIFSRVKDE